MDSFEISDMVFREQGLKERKKEDFGKQIASSDTNLKNRVSRE